MRTPDVQRLTAVLVLIGTVIQVLNEVKRLQR